MNWARRSGRLTSSVVLLTHSWDSMLQSRMRSFTFGPTWLLFPHLDQFEVPHQLAITSANSKFNCTNSCSFDHWNSDAIQFFCFSSNVMCMLSIVGAADSVTAITALMVNRDEIAYFSSYSKEWEQGRRKTRVTLNAGSDRKPDHYRRDRVYDLVNELVHLYL